MQATKTPSTLCTLRSSLAVLKASGKGVREYLQGQISQDIKLLTDSNPIYTAVLTPQGKMIADMHTMDTGDELIMLTQGTFATTLVERLRRFALGHDIRLGMVESLAVLSIQGESCENIAQQISQPIEASMSMPEADEHGLWLIMQQEDARAALNHWKATNAPSIEEYTEEQLENAAIIHGTPRFGRDWDASIHPLNANLIEMNGVSFDKGCYVGQEVTSRMHWRGGIKKKLYRVQVHGDMPNMPNTPCPILTSNKIGTLTACATSKSNQNYGIAHLPIEIAESSAKLQLQNGAKISILEPCHA